VGGLPRPSRGQEQALTGRWIPPAPDAEAVQDVDDVEKTLWDEKTVGIDVSTATETDAVVVA